MRRCLQLLADFLVLAAVSLGAGCADWTARDDPHALDGLRRFDKALLEGRAYDEMVAILDEIRRMRDADEVALDIAKRSFTITFVYERPVRDVEAALRERLAVDDDPVYRSLAAGAAYATYPQLAPYFDVTVAELEAMPRTPTRDSALDAARRVRARVELAGRLRDDAW